MCVGKARCVMKKLIKTLILFCAIIPLFFLQTSALAESIPEIAPLSGVYDPNGYLSKEAVEKVSTFNWAHTNADEKRFQVIHRQLKFQLQKLLAIKQKKERILKILSKVS